MANSDEFLKKVYDRYLGADYEYGTSDLNPKREISKTSFQSIEDEERAILNKVAERIEAIKNSLATLPNYKIPEKVNNDDFEVETSGGGFLPDKQPEISKSKIIALNNAGLSPISNNIFIPSSGNDNDLDFYLGQLDALIPSVISILDDTSSPFEDIAGFANMFNVGCDGFAYEEVLEKDFKDKKKKGKGEEKEKKDNESTDDENDENEDQSSFVDDENESASEKADNAEAANITKSVAECAAMELGILQVILTILRVLNVLKKSIILIMSILVPIVKLIAFAAQCWINPPAGAQAIQMVAEKIAALIIGLMGQILQIIWNSLELDCKTAQVQDLLDKINEVLAGVDSAINMGESIVNFTKSNIEEINKEFEFIADAFSKDPGIIEEWNKLKENGLTTLKDEFSKNMFGEYGVSKLGIKEFFKKSLGMAGVGDQLNAIIRKTQEATKRTQKLAKKATSNQKINNSLEKVGGFIGSFEIN